jgi:hypothetical protein
MQTIVSQSKLMSLLMVYLSENYENRPNACDECKSITPPFGKSFLINGKWVCLNCVVNRIEDKRNPLWHLPVTKTET